MLDSTAPAAPRHIASMAAGDLVECDGILYTLTTCCSASVTGTEHGAACRACYRPLPDWAGWAAMLDADDAAESLAFYLERAWNISHGAPFEIADAIIANARRIVAGE